MPLLEAGSIKTNFDTIKGGRRTKSGISKKFDQQENIAYTEHGESFNLSFTNFKLMPTWREGISGSPITPHTTPNKHIERYQYGNPDEKEVMVI